MPMNFLFALATVTVTVASPRIAAADASDRSEDEAYALLGGMMVLEPLPLVLGTMDLFGRTPTKGHGVLEITAGTAALAFNAYLISDQGARDSGLGLLVGLAAIDAAVIAHGIYCVTRSEQPRVAQARLHLAPTAVSDGKATVAGLGVGGTF